jgi:hypothetical protein
MDKHNHSQKDSPKPLTLATTFRFGIGNALTKTSDPHTNTTARASPYDQATAHTHLTTFQSQPSTHECLPKYAGTSACQNTLARLLANVRWDERLPKHTGTRRALAKTR